MRLLYITYVDFDNPESASGIRPKMMYKAFEDLGVDIVLLEGLQSKYRMKDRKRRVEQIIKQLDEDLSPDICYIELPSGPIFNCIDIELIKKISNMKIPTSVFYRDAMWKFPESWGISFFKRMLLTALEKRDIRVFDRYVDIVYFPSDELASYFNFKRAKVDILPPGGNEEPFLFDNFDECKCVFAAGGGAFSDRYGGKKIIEIFKILNSSGEKRYNLCILTTEEAKLEVEDREYEWLEFRHTYDRGEIGEIYEEATFALTFYRDEPCLDTAVPFKLFEYIGYGIPVISTAREGIARILSKGGCGITVEDDTKKAAVEFHQILNDREGYEKLKRNVVEVSKANRWVDRAEKVIEDLIEIRNAKSKGDN